MDKKKKYEGMVSPRMTQKRLVFILVWHITCIYHMGRRSQRGRRRRVGEGWGGGGGGGGWVWSHFWQSVQLSKTTKLPKVDRGLVSGSRILRKVQLGVQEWRWYICLGLLLSLRHKNFSSVENQVTSAKFLVYPTDQSLVLQKIIFGDRKMHLSGNFISRFCFSCEL